MIDPRLSLLLDPVHGVGRPGELLRAAVAGGVTAVRVRSPAATTRELHASVRDVRDALTGTGVAVTVDGRLDVALAAGVDGVHLGRDDLPPGPARRVADAGRARFSIGWSVDRPEHVAAARALPPGTVDLLDAGPVFASPTEPDAGAGIGPRALADLVAAASVPVVAVGGVTRERVANVLAAGVSGLAVSSAISDAADPEEATRALRRAVDAHLGPGRRAGSWGARG